MMNLKPFDCLQPRSIDELMEIMAAEDTEDSVLMGGGTDVLTRIGQGLISPRRVISLRRLWELKSLEQRDNEFFIGAGVSLHTLADDPFIGDNFPALAQAAGCVGSPQLRNMGTIGGNIRLDTRCLYLNQRQWSGSFPPCYKRGGDICHVAKGSGRCYALFCADTPAALLVHDARILIAGPGGAREISLDEFYRDSGLSPCCIEKNEFITGIRLPLRPRTASRYMRISARGAIDFPIVGVAAALEQDAQGSSLRLAATGILSRPVRLRRMEEILVGGHGVRKITDKEWKEGLSDIKPVRHFGLSPSYRQELLRVLVERILADLAG